MARLSLKYPNGRSHELDYEGPLRFELGSEFELYGRRWRVAQHRHPRNAARDGSARIVECVPLTESALSRLGPARGAV